MHRRIGSKSFWTSLAMLTLIAATLPCVLRQSVHRQATPAPQASALPPTPQLYTHSEVLPITTLERFQALEKRLEKMGFETCWFKDGPNMSGHSLVGSYEGAEFRIAMTRYTSGTVNVSLQTSAPSRKPALDGLVSMPDGYKEA
jgi:hypothetical protein